MLLVQKAGNLPDSNLILHWQSDLIPSSALETNLDELTGTSKQVKLSAYGNSDRLPLELGYYRVNELNVNVRRSNVFLQFLISSSASITTLA